MSAQTKPRVLVTGAMCRPTFETNLWFLHQVIAKSSTVLFVKYQSWIKLHQNITHLTLTLNTKTGPVKTCFETTRQFEAVLRFTSHTVLIQQME